jgi:glycosyltransferase involved in cell wall biosynthesis
VVTGPETPDLRRDLALAGRLELTRHVSWIGEVDEADLPALLRLASCVAVLSRSEGFGLPVLEALASGTPVLVPPDSAQAEVAGPAGIAVVPHDPASVADGLEHALRTREVSRRTLPERARAFTWERWAEAVEQLWLALAGRDAHAH